MIATFSRTSEVNDILQRAVDGERLTPDEGLALLESHDLTAIGRAADAVTRRLHPEPYRTYNIDRNINYTNVCTAVCDFCAFYRPVETCRGYVLPSEVLYQKIEETVDLGGDQILMQGGLHPQLPLEWYEDLLRDIKAHFPQVNVHGFSPPELHHFTKVIKLPFARVLERLKEPGSAACPAAAARFSSTASASTSRAARCSPTTGSNVKRVWHELGGTQHRDDDVRPRRNARRADRTSRALRDTAGRNRRLHRLHLLDVSAPEKPPGSDAMPSRDAAAASTCRNSRRPARSSI